MPSLRCGHCEKLFQYREQIVALRGSDGDLAAGYTIEGEGGAIAETFEPVGKYHVECYATMREKEPERWPELP
jgi:hypothetical protein